MVTKEDNSGTGYKDGQHPFFLYNHAVLRHKTTKVLIFVSLFNLNNNLNDLIVGSLNRNKSCY